MNRREFLKTSGAAAATWGAAQHVTGVSAKAATGGAGDKRRPNILYIFTDQQTGSAMSCVGNKYLKTPAIDSLAAEGVVFDRTYCAQPLCVPSRTVMMTSRLPHETKVEYNIKYRRIEFPMLGRVLADAGYETGYLGKWHLPMPQKDAERHGFQSIACQVTAGKKTKKDYDIPGAAVEFFKKQRSKPFFLVASFLNPHDICQWARGDDLPNGPVPPVPPPDDCPPLPDNFAIPKDEPTVIRKVQAQGGRIYPTVDWPDERWRQYRWAYYRLVEMVDREIGKLLKALRDAGHGEDTVVIFSSDHGDGVAAHHWNQKQVLYEEPARVPFIVSQKGVTRAGHIDREHLISNGLDLMPTLCDYAGVRPPEGVRGMSARPIAEGRKPPGWRDQVVVETSLGGPRDSLGIGGRALRTQRYKYIVYDQGERREQLFDMESDPGETKSLVRSAEHREVLDEHRRRLAAWCRLTGDRFPVPEVRS